MDSLNDLIALLPKLEVATVELKDVSEKAFEYPPGVWDQMAESDKKLINEARNAFKLTGSVAAKAEVLLKKVIKHA